MQYLGLFMGGVKFMAEKKQKHKKVEQSEAAEFFDVKSKKKFKTTSYAVVERSGRFFIVADSPTGDYECWKVVAKDKAAKLKK